MVNFNIFLKNYKDDYWPHFKKFIFESFNSKYILGSRNFFNWQYNSPDNIYSSASMKVLIKDNVFLGYLGLIPVKLKVFDELISGCALCNLMISKSCRVFGLGTELIKGSVGDFSVLYGTGYHPKTGLMYEKLGDWKLMGDLKRYIKIVNLNRVEFLVKNNFFGEFVVREFKKENVGISIARIRKFDKRIDEFWKNISNKYPITVARSEKYLNWRYVDHPYFKYVVLVARNADKRILGYLVYRIEKMHGEEGDFKIGHILDLIAKDEAVKLLLIEAEKHMKNRGVDLIDYFSSGNFHHKEILELDYHLSIDDFYNKIPLYFNPVSYKRSEINFLVYCNKKEKYRDFIFDPNNWYITKGDGDKDRPNPH